MNNCIACGSQLGSDVVFIGKQYPSAVFVKPGDKYANGLKPSSLNLTRCLNEKCTLVQLSEQYDLDYVFKHYPFDSGSTASMPAKLKDVVRDAENAVDLQPSDVVLDIGGNDGTLLSFIESEVKARVNIDAAVDTTGFEDYKHVHAKFSEKEYSVLGLPNPKLIFSVAMFYHLNDPMIFCDEVRSIMSDDTLWVIQMTYLGTMLRDNIFDNIVHEHAAYYSLYSVEQLLNSVGLYVNEARVVNSYGGSLRLFVSKDPDRKIPLPEIKFRTCIINHFDTVGEFIVNPNRKVSYDLEDKKSVIRFEMSNEVNELHSLDAFNTRVQLLRKILQNQICHLVDTHGPIWAFGASTKGNMILQFLGFNQTQIKCILDNSIKKIGSMTIGSKIPIEDEAMFLHYVSGYMLVLPYYYIDSFVEIIRKKLPKWREIHLIVPLPYPKIITININGVV